MTLEELIKKLECGEKIECNIDVQEWEKGTMREVRNTTLKKLNKYDYNGIYIIYDNSNKIKYVGESYKRTVGKRLKLQASGHKTNSTLAKHIANHELNTSLENITESQKAEMFRIMEELNVLAIKCDDLETFLIHTLKPEYNTAGKR